MRWASTFEQPRVTKPTYQKPTTRNTTDISTSASVASSMKKSSTPKRCDSQITARPSSEKQSSDRACRFSGTLAPSVLRQPCHMVQTMPANAMTTM